MYFLMRLWILKITATIQNVLSALCPKTAQTILEDEVDDPVYQVGLWAHTARPKHSWLWRYCSFTGAVFTLKAQNKNYWSLI